MQISMSDEQSHDLIDGSSEAKADEKSEIRKQVEQYLGKRYDVHLTDGRIVSGVMIATDKDANMILLQAEERWSQNPDKGSRQLGQAMISKKHVVEMYLAPEPVHRVIPTLLTTLASPPKPSTPLEEPEVPSPIPSPVAPKPAAKNASKQKSKKKKSKK